MSKDNELQTIVQRLLAPSDPKGNPRRCYVVYELIGGKVLGVYDEGYHGWHAVPQNIRDSVVTMLPSIPVSYKVYREFLKLNEQVKVA